MKTKIMKDSYDESDFHYDRKIKSPISEGTNMIWIVTGEISTEVILR